MDETCPVSTEGREGGYRRVVRLVYERAHALRAPRARQRRATRTADEGPPPRTPPLPPLPTDAPTRVPTVHSLPHSDPGARATPARSPPRARAGCFVSVVGRATPWGGSDGVGPPRDKSVTPEMDLFAGAPRDPPWSACPPGSQQGGPPPARAPAGSRIERGVSLSKRLLRDLKAGCGAAVWRR